MDFPILTCCFQMSNATESIPKACSHVLKRMYWIYYVLSLIKQCYGNYIKEKVTSYRIKLPCREFQNKCLCHLHLNKVVRAGHFFFF